MHDSYLIRAGSGADVPTIAQQRSHMFRAMDDADDAILAPMVDAFIPWVASRIVTGSYLSWLAETNDKLVVGGLGLMLIDWPPGLLDLNTRRGYILNVYVEPEHRRHGLARRLADSAISYCRDQNIRVVALHASTDGHPLYAALGFQPTNELRLLLE